MRAYKYKMPYNESNQSLYHYIIEKLNSDKEEKLLLIGKKLVYINIEETLNKVINLLFEKDIFNNDDSIILKFNRNLKAREYSKNINNKIKASFYGYYLQYNYLINYLLNFDIENNLKFHFKIANELLYTNIDDVFEQVKKEVTLHHENIISQSKLSTTEKEDLLSFMINSAIRSDYKNNSKTFKKEVEFLKEIKSELPKPTIEEQTITNENEHLKILEKIWLVNAKIDLEVFLNQGIEKGIWNENYEIITKRNSIYGSGKTLLASLSIALKDWCINSETNYNIIGEAFCSFFKIEVKQTTIQKYKSFQTGNPKYTKELKRAFNIKTKNS